MYPITHAWFLSELWGEPDDVALLGALFPDTIIASGLDWGLTHRPGINKLVQLAAVSPEALRFSLGWLSHGTDPHGLDYFGDESYPGTKRGYCFELAEPYAERAARICGLSDELGWWKAHNFIEMGIELHAAHSVSDIGKISQRVLPGSADCRGLFAELAPLVGGNVEQIVDGFIRFPTYLELVDLTPGGLARSYEVQVRAKHHVEGIDVDDAAALIEECRLLVADSLEEFLAFAVRSVREGAEALGLPSRISG